MSLSWHTRKSRLGNLLDSQGNEDDDALALDRLLHGQSVIGKTAKTTEIDTLRFGDKDLRVIGTLEYGQFGVIDVVTCQLDGRVYVRKSVEKQFAYKTRDQCSPQFERDLLLASRKNSSHWAPHLLCAFQSSTHLHIVMTYAEGGNLWDVLESSPLDGNISEDDLKWWTPQIVSAVGWCHAQGFAHRDIKPHNFVLTRDAHLLLIDFGSAAPLLLEEKGGNERRGIAKKYCLVPCGTCDYVSPEILRVHEEALVALELAMEDDDDDAETPKRQKDEDCDKDNLTEGYGKETDWWSTGAMLFEMAYGVAPFFAKDIRQTYLRIMDHETSLRFPRAIPVSAAYEDLLRKLLAPAETRLGRKGVHELVQHTFFEDTDWRDLHLQSAPEGLHLPQFTYNSPIATSVSYTPKPLAPFNQSPYQTEGEPSQAFAFSALFQSSRGSSSPAVSALHSTPSHRLARSAIRETGATAFIGFSWGPAADAFPRAELVAETPRPAFRSSQSTPFPKHGSTFATPLRASSVPHRFPHGSTVRRSTVQRRLISDREAMKQLVDLVGMSARKKVIESGRKPRVLTLPITRSSGMGSFMKLKDVRFDNGSDDEDEFPGTRDREPTGTMTQVIEYPLESTYSDSEGPASPSPSPRPGSAMSMLSRRSTTPTISASYSNQRLGVGMNPTTGSSSNILSVFPLPPTPTLPRMRSGEDGRAARDEDVTFTAGTFDALEERHACMLEDLDDIEERLTRLLTQVM
ncbi:hypothetical protein HWV62_27709 [Athelia sp. TMB]|nr:hypothetical protein HWV62_27709 [Athelia sp. TMB]